MTTPRKLNRANEKKNRVMTPQKGNTKDPDNNKSMIYSESYQGMIPHPNHLERYDQLSPGAAKEIINMATKEQELHIELTRKALDSNISLQTRGQHYGFIITLFSLAIGGYAVHLGHEVAGSIIGGLGIAQIVLALLGKRDK